MTVTVLVPAGVPGLLGPLLLPPPQAGIQSVWYQNRDQARPTALRVRLPADTTSPSKPGEASHRRGPCSVRRGFCPSLPRELWL